MISLDNPDYTIFINTLARPSDLMNLFKNANLKDYCYAFYTNVPAHNIKILMNIGMSTGTEIGDRIYRKVGNLPGWGSLTLTGNFGADMKDVVNAVEAKYAHLNLKIHKDDVTLDIWNTKDLTVDSFNDPTIEAEKILIQDCKNTFGCMPAGNFQDPCTRNKSVSKTLFNSLFDS